MQGKTDRNYNALKKRIEFYRFNQVFQSSYV